MSSLVDVEKKDAVALLYLNRPDSLNAVSYALINELCAALEKLDADSAIRVMVIAGRGKAFCAGADVKEMSSETTEALNKRDPFVAWDRLLKISKPTIAAVHGYALGGGLELAMSCDMIVAAEGAQLGQPEILLGIIPGAGGTQRLTRAVGSRRAMELILTGRRFKAEEALAWGLVNRVVPADKVLPEALALAQEIAKMPATAVKHAKNAVNQAGDLSLADGLKAERRLFYSLFSTHDQKEGMKAFSEKRKPQFKGE